MKNTGSTEKYLFSATVGADRRSQKIVLTGNIAFKNRVYWNRIYEINLHFAVPVKFLSGKTEEENRWNRTDLRIKRMMKRLKNRAEKGIHSTNLSEIYL